MANRNDRYKRLSSYEDLNWRASQSTRPQHTQREITAPINPQPPRAQGNPQVTPSQNNVRIRSSITERNQRMQMRSEVLSDGGGSTTSSDASHNNNRSQTSRSTAIIENNGVTPHSHTACLECATFLSYNIWNNCPPGATHPEYKVVDGPCNHCAREGEEVKLHCEPLRCSKCLEGLSIRQMMDRRDRRLLDRGYTKDDNYTFSKPREGRHGRVYAEWKDVRFGPCQLTPMEESRQARLIQITELAGRQAGRW